MNFQDFIKNFPWNRFGHAYGNAPDLKEKLIKIFNGIAEDIDYKFVTDRIENQETFFWISPLILKLYIMLLDNEKSSKIILLEHISRIYEAANYNAKCDLAVEYKSSNKMLEKYNKIKGFFFSEEFNGTIEPEMLKMYKSLDRNFMHIMTLDFIKHYKNYLEGFMKSNDKKISEMAESLIKSIDNPRRFDFDGIEY